MFQDKDDLIKSYRNSFSSHGPTPEGQNMHKEEQQYRFSKALKILRLFLEDYPKEEITVLDVGCGLCDFYDYLTEHLDVRIKYTGIDIVDDYVQYASSNKSVRVKTHDLLEGNLPESFDFVVGLAIFSRRTRENYLETMIDRMAYHSKCGVIFDCNSSINYIGSFEKYEPQHVISLCSVISKKFYLFHDPKIKNMFFGLDTSNSNWRIGQGGAK